MCFSPNSTYVYEIWIIDTNHSFFTWGFKTMLWMDVDEIWRQRYFWIFYSHSLGGPWPAPTPLVLSPDCRGGVGHCFRGLVNTIHHRQDLWITSKLCREGGGSSGQCCPQYTGNKLSRASLRLIRCLIFYLPQPRGILCVERSVHAVFARWLPGQQGVRPVVTRWSELVTRCDIRDNEDSSSPLASTLPLPCLCP